MYITSLPSSHDSTRFSPRLLSFALLTGLLLFAGWLRMQHIVSFYEWPDEIWSLWHVQGTFSEALSRVPYDWPPLFSVVAWVWMQLAGQTLEASRALMVLWALLSMAFMYRGALRFFALAAPTAAGNKGAAWIALAAAISFGYLVYSGVEERAYGMVLMWGALAFWLLLRWMHRPQSWRRTILLGVVLGLSFFTTFTSVLYIAFLSGVVVLMRPRLIFRWALVGGVAIIAALPAVVQFIQNAGNRLNVMPQPPAGFAVEMLSIYQQYGGTVTQAAIIGLALLVVLVMTLRRRFNWRWGLVLLLWVSVPALIYIVRPNREYLNVRYAWWVAWGLVLLVGTAALYLPRFMQCGVVVLLLGMSLLPVDWLQFRSSATEAAPMRMVLSWFAQHIRPGDVIIKDPYCACGVPIAWDYFLPQFFPQGDLPWVTEPGNHSRVWYLATTGWKQDEALKADIMNGRKESIFVGPWNFLLRLYEGPPIWRGVPFSNQITLNGYEISDNRDTFRENDTFQVKLWWSALRKPDMDYSISLAVLDKYGNILTQVDGPARAEGTPEQMSAWEKGKYYEDYRTITLPTGTAAQEYQLVVTIYDWQTGRRLIPAPNAEFPLAGQQKDYLLLRTFSVVSY